MSKRTQDKARPRRGFTLTELLVAIAVLSLMLVTLATMTSFVTKIWLSGLGAADNYTKARVVLNLMDRDIQNMVLRRDLAAFVDGTGNTALCRFYTNEAGQPGTGFTGGTFDTRSVSLVQYSLATTATTAMLQRLNYGMNFLPASSGARPVVGSTTTLAVPSNATLQTDTLFTGIVQFEWQFIDGTGTIQTPSSTTPFVYNFASPGATSNYRAVIISMVVLNNYAYTIATKNTTCMAMLTGTTCFSTTAPTNQTYSQVWNAFLAAPSTSFSTLPEPVRRGIQVFERHIPLPFTPPTH